MGPGLKTGVSRVLKVQRKEVGRQRSPGFKVSSPDLFYLIYKNLSITAKSQIWKVTGTERQQQREIERQIDRETDR